MSAAAPPSPPSTPSHPSARWRYLLLLVLLALVALFQARHLIECARYLRAPHLRVEAPFILRPMSDLVGPVRPTAQAAGLRRGDRILSIDDMPLLGRSTLNVALSRHQPGDILKVRAQSPDGHIRTLLIPLIPDPDYQLNTLTTITLSIFTPLVCVLLGFAVAFIRPFDSRAWIVLFLLLSFAALAEAGPVAVDSWDSPLRPYGVFLRSLAASTWPIWMVLFGLYFPDRLSLDQRYRFAKFLLLVPLIYGSLQTTLFSVLSEENWRAGVWLTSAFFRLQRAPMVISILGASAFFATLIFRLRTERHRDARRRLKLLLLGTALALTPMLLVVIGFAFFGGYRLLRFLDWTIFLLALPLPLFPLTLAYVIVVERAMDLRLVVRQSLQYAVAQKSLLALRVLTALAAIVIIVRFDSLGELSLPARVQLAALLVGGVFLAQRLLGGMANWVDRHFFRDALQTEQMLLQLSENVRTIVEPHSLLETVSAQIAQALNVDGVAALVRNNGSFSPAHITGSLPADSSLVFPLDSPLIQKLRAEPKALTLSHDATPWLPEEDRRRLAALNAQLLLPLSGKHDLLGILSLGPKKSEEPYSRADLRLLQTVATQTGLSLENGRLTLAIAAEEAAKRRYEREIEIAREVQQTLFPQQTPEIPGLLYAGHCRSAAGVGGDYYDFIPLANHNLGIAIGDVSGKGIPGALLMASLQAFLRGQKIGGAANLAELMANINRQLYETSSSSRYATLFYAEYDPSQHLLRYVNAGHNPPVLLRGDAVIHLTASGPVVGLLPHVHYEEQSVQLRPGDLLIGYTDGVTEALNPNEQEWGEAAMLAAAMECRHLPPAQIIEHLLAAADAFAAGAPQNDDMTLVVLRVTA